MIRLIIFEGAWIFFHILLIAVAYGYLLKFYKLFIMGAFAVVGAMFPLFRQLSHEIHMTGPLVCLAVSLVFLYFNAEGIINEPILDRKTAFLRAGMMALSTLGTDKKVYRTFFQEDPYDENGARISQCKLPTDFVRQCRMIKGSHVEIYTPKEPNEKVVYMFPGGGFAGRFTDFKMSYVWDYSEALHGATVVVLDYMTTLDGAHYPQPLNESVRVYEWLLERGIAPGNILVAGDSAGGNLELVFFHYLREHRMPMPRAGVTFSAWTDLTATSISYKTKKRYDAVFGGNNVVRIAAKHYIEGTGKALNDIGVSPYFIDDFTGFPAMLMQVGSHEQLLSGTVDVAYKMMQSDVDVTVEVYAGMYHEFQRGKRFNYQAAEAWEMVEKFCDRVFQKPIVNNEWKKCHE